MYRFIIVGSIIVLAGVAGILSLSPGEPPAEFRMANNEECRTLDPHLMQWTHEIRIGYALFEGLTTPDPVTSKPRPGVASSWDVSPDGLRYTFHLRPDARWSNGEPVSAPDFVYSWERALNPRIASDYSNALFVLRNGRRYYESISARDRDGLSAILPFADVGVTALDAHTLDVRLEHPCTYFLELISGSIPSFWPVYRPALEGVAYDWPPSLESAPPEPYDAGKDRPATRHQWTRPRALVCNGPFVLASWHFKHKMRLVKNPYYWDAGQVALRSIEVMPVPDRNTRFMAYETGAADLVMDPSTAVSRVLYQRMNEGRRPDYLHGDNYATYFYRLNVTRPPLDDARVRQALAQAIDREELCRVVWGFGQKPARTLVPQHFQVNASMTDSEDSSFVYSGPAGLSFDPRRARDALQQAGWAPSGVDGRRIRDGKPFPTLALLYNTDAAHDAMAQAVAHMWREHLGIRVELLNVESKVFHERVRKLDYDVARASWYGDYLDPSTFLDVFRSDSGNNRTGFADRQYDALLNSARTERDAANRLALLAEAERILIEEQVPIIPLNYYVGAHLLSPRFTGVSANARQLVLLRHVRPCS